MSKSDLIWCIAVGIIIGGMVLYGLIQYFNGAEQKEANDMAAKKRIGFRPS